MTPIKKMLNKLNGLHYSQEYLCLSKETLERPLHAYLVNKGQVTKDITDLHLFVGYCPLIIAFPLSAVDNEQQTLNVIFTNERFQPNEFLPKKDAIAALSLKKICSLKATDVTILFYQGVTGTHRFISKYHQFILQLYNRLYNKKTGNVFLESNLYKQVQIAYAIPRKICLITVGEGHLFNHFPTDLHGGISDTHYIISLRHEGAACKQVETLKKIVLSDMQASEYKKAYALGKNHTRPLKDISEFDFDSARSKHFLQPLPKNLLSYKELELESSFVHGIHKILLFKIVYEEKRGAKQETLSHVHNSYATWRHNHKLSSNFLLR